MWKVLFASRSEEMLKGYIDLYREYFLDIFDDTGLWSEELIRNRYIEAANSLQVDIREAIVIGLSREIIGHTDIDTDIKSAVFHTEKRSILVEYSEDPKNHTRYVWFIRIHRQK